VTAAPLRLLVTGPPGVDKTTLVRGVVGRLPGVRVAGFYTQEVSGPSGRTGFRAVTFDGRQARLATAEAGDGPRVGRYAVHLAEFEALALPSLASRPDIDLVVMDEIGKMECLSPAFEAAARQALSGTVPVLATVALRGGGFIAEAKRLPGVEVVEMAREGRDRLAGEIAARLGAELRRHG
jgi:nucleoside-triphosphatase